MLIGAPVLVATVKGLQVAQSMKKAQQWEQQLAARAASEQQQAPPFMAGGAEPGIAQGPEVAGDGQMMVSATPDPILPCSPCWAAESGLVSAR